jgi:ERCC4-type nuclease
MKLYVDNRETKLYSLLVAFNFYNQADYDIIDESETTKTREKDALLIQSKQLDLGDIVLCDNNDEIILLFERKSVADLASSIQDGRYKEQSSRLNSFSLNNHNIIYIIEGNIDRVNSKTRIKPNTLKSAVVSLNLNKEFSILNTNSIDDTARWILAYCYKVEKDKNLELKLKSTINKPTNEYNNRTTDINDVNINSNDIRDRHLECLSKQAKSKYINKDNCQCLMLSMIPYVSTNIAKSILDEFGTIDKLMVSLREDDKCLNKIKVKTNGKERAIGKNVIKTIINFLS